MTTSYVPVVLHFDSASTVTPQDLEKTLQKQDLNNVCGVKVLSHHIKLTGSPSQIPPVVYLATNLGSSSISGFGAAGGPLRNVIAIPTHPIVYDAAANITISAAFDNENLKPPYRPMLTQFGSLISTQKTPVPPQFLASLGVDSSSTYAATASPSDPSIPLSKAITLGGSSMVLLEFACSTETISLDRGVFDGRDNVSRGFSGNI